jgi:ATP-dependent RNA helicase HelY
VAALASSRSFHLNSAFRPTYNMAANLVRSYSSERAHHLLNLSFAQYQADREVVKIEARLERRQMHLRELTNSSKSPYGDIDEYRRLLKSADAVHRPPTIGRDDPVELALLKLRPGDVLWAEKGKYVGKVAVLTTAHRKGGMRVSGLTMRRDPIALSAPDFDLPPKAIGHIDLPADFAPNRHDYQREVVHRLERAETLPVPRAGRRRRAIEDALDHPVEQDPDLAGRMKSALQAERVAREVDELRQRVTGRSSTIARDFDRVLRILESWGYVDGWSLTEAGDILARTFHESDLLIVECLRRGLFDGLEPAHLAGLVSVFVYEHRSAEPPPMPWFPSGPVRKRWREIAAISDELQGVEEEAGLTVHRAPDPTFIAVAFAWAAGEGFAEVVEAEELSGGDFVRTTKQLIDVLRQLALVAPVRETRRAAEAASQALFRGVVAASSAVDVEVDDDVPPELDPPDPTPKPLPGT